MNSLGVIGECMLELRQHNDDFRLGYGGDVFNTAVYAQRLGLSVDFFTAVGDDHYSDYLIEAWQKEGVKTQAVRVIANATPSLYMIQTDTSGERMFHYWRDTSPFKRWLDLGDYLDGLADQLSQCEFVYFSGISLALLSHQKRTDLLKQLSDYRQRDGKIGFDPNYRPRLWQDEPDVASWMDRAYEISDIAFPSYDDEALLRGEADHTKLIAHIKELGVPEIVMKDGINGAMVTIGNETTPLAAEQIDDVVDTTAAGDSFNGGYLATRLRGGTAFESAKRGCQMAAQVIQHRGAIIPRDTHA